MKKFVTLVFSLGLLLVIAAGCSTKISTHSAPLEVKVRADLKADIEVGEKVSGKASKTYLFGLYFLPIKWFNKYAEGVNYYDNRNAWRDGGYAGLNSQGVPTFFREEHSDIKRAAAYDAIHDSGADILVAPRYEIEDYYFILFSHETATVTGYKGKIKGFKENISPTLRLE